MNMQGELKRQLALTVLATGLFVWGCAPGDRGGETVKFVSPPAAVEGNPDLVAEVGPYRAFGRQRWDEISAKPGFLLPGSKEFTRFILDLPKISLESLGIEDRKSAPLKMADPRRQEASLVLALPIKQLGEEFVFGGVITKVSDQESPTIGTLKLTELTPLNVRPFVTGDEAKGFYLSLIGCDMDCNEKSKETSLLDIPLLGADQVAGTLMADLSSLGQELNLISFFDPDGALWKLKPRASYTTLMDYSDSTLIFDVETEMIPLTRELVDTAAPITKFTFRWYLKRANGFEVNFVRRSPTDGVGFFTTSRASEPQIARRALESKEKNIHYFIKNVPQEYQEAFRKGLEAWNQTLLPMFGRKVITYEFLKADDPKNSYVMPGDIRFNVIEWDSTNKAVYVAFGPFQANQKTGEIFSSNILFQGPSLIATLKAWFKLSEKVRDLQKEGRDQDAQMLWSAFARETSKKNRIGKIEATFASHPLKVGAVSAPLQDTLKLDSLFLDDLLPTGSFEDYINSYLEYTVEHEVGHNLGLRHNFRGNLGDDGTHRVGSTSHSVMEYMGRNYDYISRISHYDLMAIKYGYLGTPPTATNLYCGDEEVINPMNMLIASPECTPEDMTADPFGNMEMRLGKAVSYLINRGSSAAPLWKLEELADVVVPSIMGMGFYGASGLATSQRWTNFFREGRPTAPEKIRAYVLERLRAQLCDPSFFAEIQMKSTQEARSATIQNIVLLRGGVSRILERAGIFSSAELDCRR